MMGGKQVDGVKRVPSPYSASGIHHPLNLYFTFHHLLQSHRRRKAHIDHIPRNCKRGARNPLHTRTDTRRWKPPEDNILSLCVIYSFPSISAYPSTSSNRRDRGRTPNPRGDKGGVEAEAAQQMAVDVPSTRPRAPPTLSPCARTPVYVSLSAIHHLLCSFPPSTHSFMYLLPTSASSFPPASLAGKSCATPERAREAGE